MSVSDNISVSLSVADAGLVVDALWHAMRDAETELADANELAEIGNSLGERTHFAGKALEIALKAKRLEMINGVICDALIDAGHGVAEELGETSASEA